MLLSALLFVAAPVWSNAPEHVSIMSERAYLGRRIYQFNVNGADALDLRFDQSLRTLTFDAHVVTKNGTRLAVVEDARLSDDRLRAEWGLADVWLVEITVHAHGRKLHLYDYWVRLKGDRS